MISRIISIVGWAAAALGTFCMVNGSPPDFWGALIVLANAFFGWVNWSYANAARRERDKDQEETARFVAGARCLRGIRRHDR